MKAALTKGLLTNIRPLIKAMDYPKQSGTYCFHNTINNKVYVGSAKCLYTRINNHCYGRAKDSNRLLRQSILKRGLKAYGITYVVTETHAEAKMQEQLMLNYLFQNNIPKYNLSANAYGGNGSNAKTRYALEVNSPANIYTFKSSYEAARFTKVIFSSVLTSCKKARPMNGQGRWLFSDISIADLICKFKALKTSQISGENNYSKGFILINKITRAQSSVFYSVLEPQRANLNVNPSHLSQCLQGKRKSVSNHYIT